MKMETICLKFNFLVFFKFLVAVDCSIFPPEEFVKDFAENLSLNAISFVVGRDSMHFRSYDFGKFSA